MEPADRTETMGRAGYWGHPGSYQGQVEGKKVQAWALTGPIVPKSMSQCSHCGSRVNCSDGTDSWDLVVWSDLGMDGSTGSGSGTLWMALPPGKAGMEGGSAHHRV